MSTSSPHSSTDSLGLGFGSTARDVGRQLFLRADPKYRVYFDLENGRSFSPLGREIRLRECMLPYFPKMVQKGPLPQARRILDLADVAPNTSIIIQNDDGSDRFVEAVGSTRLDFSDCDLVFSRLEPYLGKIVFNDRSQEWIGTSEWIPLRINSDLASPLFLKWLLLSPQLINVFGTYWKLRSGKRHARMNQWELEHLRIPLPPRELQLKVVPQLISLESDLVDTYRKIRTKPAVIEEVFRAAFGYNTDEYDANAEVKSFVVSTSELAKSTDIRCGVRFHHPRFIALDKILEALPTVRFRDIVYAPVRLGATVHPDTDYDDEGEAAYVSPAVIKNYDFDFSVATSLDDPFYSKNARQFGLNEDDLVIARSGEGTIGKAALYTGDQPCIYS